MRIPIEFRIIKYPQGEESLKPAFPLSAIFKRGFSAERIDSELPKLEADYLQLVKRLKRLKKQKKQAKTQALIDGFVARHRYFEFPTLLGDLKRDTKQKKKKGGKDNEVSMARM